MIVSKSGNTSHGILLNLLSILSLFLNYSDNEGDMKMCLNHYQTSYWNSDKEDLKSDNTCLAIKKIARSIEKLSFRVVSFVTS